MQNIAIFASGRGSNAQKIIQHFAANEKARVALIVTNNKDAGVIGIAEEENIPLEVINKKNLSNQGHVLSILDSYQIDFIVLAGYLLLIPSFLVHAFHGRMLNIHPALLPKFGGKGMYGMRVHEAVKEAGEIETGITVHFVNESFDEGNIVFQAKTPVFPDEEPGDIAASVRILEHEYFPKVIQTCVELLETYPSDEEE